MSEFNTELFITKVNNVFVKLYTAIMKENLEEVNHFINDEVYNKFSEVIKNLSSKNLRQIYDELNVKDTIIISRNILDNKEVVKVKLISRYMDYLINKDTGKFVSGDNTKRVERENILTFEKNLNTKEKGLVRKCPGCGASISVNTTGVCSYCGSVYNLEDYDYILTSIETY